MGKPMYNLGKTANLKLQQQKQMDRDLRRRAAKQSKANIKAITPAKTSDTAEPGKVAEIAESTT